MGSIPTRPTISTRAYESSHLFKSLCTLNGRTPIAAHAASKSEAVVEMVRGFAEALNIDSFKMRIEKKQLGKEPSST